MTSKLKSVPLCRDPCVIDDSEASANYRFAVLLVSDLARREKLAAQRYAVRKCHYDLCENLHVGSLVLTRGEVLSCKVRQISNQHLREFVFSAGQIWLL